MNNLIRYAESAKIHFSRVGILDGDPNGTARYVQYDKLDKFAESIVKDCIIIIQREIVRNGNTPENLRSRKHIMDIADKFGIKLPLEVKDYANI